MGIIEVAGGVPLKGEARIQGSKNAALPLMAAAVLHQGKTVLHNCPRILDVQYMAEILKELGCLVWWEGSSLFINAERLTGCRVSERFATRLRASVILMGSLLGRCGQAELPYPGGCTIGTRPIDIHLKGVEKMGASVLLEEDKIRVEARELRECEIKLPFPSVGATENILLAAARARGVCKIKDCALEPEVRELCCFLREKGVGIQGEGTGELVITGTDCLKDSEYTLMPDRIVAGTYLLAAAGTRGQITLKKARADDLQILLERMENMGAIIQKGDGWIKADARKAGEALELTRTAPYPGFPTDMQSQLMAVLCCAEGTSMIEENLFEARYLIGEELNRMGARVTIEGKVARIQGAKTLWGTSVTARDLRGGAALVTAGLMARGTTRVHGCQYIQRGYEDICRDLRELGADIHMIE